jgi:hypothetical protein
MNITTKNVLVCSVLNFYIVIPKYEFENVAVAVLATHYKTL